MSFELENSDVKMCNIFNVFSSLNLSNNQLEKFNLANVSQGKEEKNGNYDIRLEMFESIYFFSAF